VKEKTRALPLRNEFGVSFDFTRTGDETKVSFAPVKIRKAKNGKIAVDVIGKRTVGCTVKKIRG
jgi:hypothetical protein